MLLAHINFSISADVQQMMTEKGAVAKKTFLQIRDKARGFVQENPAKSAIAVAGILAGSGSGIGFFMWLRHVLLNRKTNSIVNQDDKKLETDNNNCLPKDDPNEKKEIDSKKQEIKEDLPELDQLRAELKNGEFQLNDQFAEDPQDDRKKEMEITSPKVSRFVKEKFIKDKNLTKSLKAFIKKEQVDIKGAKVGRINDAAGITIKWVGIDVDQADDNGDRKLEKINKALSRWYSKREISKTQQSIPRIHCYTTNDNVDIGKIWEQDPYEMNRLSMPVN
jgi:hypothetical protein